jgi:hypothetical protein
VELVFWLEEGLVRLNPSAKKLHEIIEASGSADDQIQSLILGLIDESNKKLDQDTIPDTKKICLVAKIEGAEINWFRDKNYASSILHFKILDMFVDFDLLEAKRCADFKFQGFQITGGSFWPKDYYLLSFNEQFSSEQTDSCITGQLSMVNTTVCKTKEDCIRNNFAIDLRRVILDFDSAFFIELTKVLIQEVVPNLLDTYEKVFSSNLYTVTWRKFKKVHASHLLLSQGALQKSQHSNVNTPKWA